MSSEDGPPRPLEPPRPRVYWLELLARCPATSSLGCVILLFFLLEAILGGTDNPEVLLRLGSVRQDLIFEHGEYYRLVCAAFLHGGLIHLAFNGLAFVQLGILVELIYGSWRMMALYLLFALGGTLCSATFHSIQSVGASGAILGLAGLLLGTSWVGRDPWRSDLRRLLGRRLLYGVLLTFALGVALQLLWIPIIDNLGHLGGFLSGLAASFLLRSPGRPTGKAIRGLAGLLVLLSLVAFAWMAIDGEEAAGRLEEDQIRIWDRVHKEQPQLAKSLAGQFAPFFVEARFDRRAHQAVFRQLEEHPDEPDALNWVAWHLVTRPDASRRQPHFALNLIKRAVTTTKRDLAQSWAPSLELHLSLLAYLDTQAVVLRALGQEAAAAVFEEQVVTGCRELLPQPEARGTCHLLLCENLDRLGRSREAWTAMDRWQDEGGEESYRLAARWHLEAARRGGEGSEDAAGAAILEVAASMQLLEKLGAERSLVSRSLLAEACTLEAEAKLLLGRLKEVEPLLQRAEELLHPDQALDLRQRIGSLRKALSHSDR